MQMTQLLNTSSVSIKSEISWAQASLIAETQAFVCFLTPRAVLSLDQSFFTHWSRGRIYPPSFVLASLSWASCMLCRSTGWISSLFYSLKAVGCGMGTVLSFYIVINRGRTPSIYVTDRNFPFGHRPSLVIEIYAFRQYFLINILSRAHRHELIHSQHLSSFSDSMY